MRRRLLEVHRLLRHVDIHVSFVAFIRVVCFATCPTQVHRYVKNEHKLYCNSNIFLFRSWVVVSLQWCRSISSFYHRHYRRCSPWLSPASQKLLLMPRSTAPTPAPKALTLDLSQSWRKRPAHGKVQLRYVVKRCPQDPPGHMGVVFVMWKSELKFLKQYLNILTLICSVTHNL